MFKNTIIILLITISIFITIEIITRIFLFFYLNNPNAGINERQKNLKYESFVMFGPGWEKKYFNNSSNNNNNKVILILGGSTAEGFPQNIIKNEFKNIFGLDVNVYNLAFGGYVAKQELINLILHINKISPDIIINISGANDIVFSLRQTKPNKFLLDSTYSNILKRPYLGPLIWILQNSQFYNSLNRFYARSKKTDFESKIEFLDSYVDTSVIISEISKLYSKKYIHILQPHLLFKNKKSKQEKKYTRYDYRNEFVKKSYNYILTQLKNKKIFNECELFNGNNFFINNEKNIFKDDVHFIDDNGYKIIIQNVLECLEEKKIKDW